MVTGAFGKGKRLLRGFSKAAPRKLSEDRTADKWVEDGLSRKGQNVSDGLQRGKRTGEEWFWRCFEHKDGREDNGSSIL